MPKGASLNRRVLLKRGALASAVAAVLPSASFLAVAQSSPWPSRPIQLVHNGVAGGAVDLTARRLADFGHEPGGDVAARRFRVDQRAGCVRCRS